MKHLCVHGHFYQPPRENPWLEAIELQDSAYPYHDWNERITAECYAPNGATRILDGDHKITRIVNNYAKISFNFGPTLLSWAREKAPELYRDILEGDRQSREMRSGHGNAIAQAYNHIIMPLANSRDKRTQIIWGIRDFISRFLRQPEGMWLPETAVDLETLSILAERGIKFTILAPSQASRVRKMAEGAEWEDVSGARIDPTRAYRCNLPNGRSIALFFYDGPVSRAVAFEGLLHRGETFAERLQSIYNDTRDWDQFAHIATDGESYGHHHRYGEMALAYALHHIETNGLAKLTNYGEFLELYPPQHEVEIFESTAWSCVHGVGRWSVNCGCNSGGHGDWNQEWRAPLRSALDWLRDRVAGPFEAELRRWTKDPWAARDDYINVVLDRNAENRRAFLTRHGMRGASPAERVRIWKALEMQRHAMLMYTSCGWFFDEISGIETVQVIEYAARVVQLAEDLFEAPVEAEFLSHLSGAKSNLPEHGDGARIYQKLVRPATVDLRKVGAHFAITSLFQNYPQQARIYCYSAEIEDFLRDEAGKLKLVRGHAKFTSEITLESDTLSFAAFHFGDHSITAGVQKFLGEGIFNDLSREASECFSRADVPGVILLLDRHFEGGVVSVKSLFKDEQRRVLDNVLQATLGEAEAIYRQMYEHHAPLLRFLQDLGSPLPRAFTIAAEYALNSRLRKLMSRAEPDVGRIRGVLDEAASGRVELDSTTLEFTYRKTLERVALKLLEEPSRLDRLHLLDDNIALARTLPFPVTLWICQNLCYEMLEKAYPEQQSAADAGDGQAIEWVEAFRRLAENLELKVEAPQAALAE